jgi:predicted helicase
MMVKFLRYGQHFIEKNGTGVLAFINPHGFLDNPTFRGMRWNLLKTYDKIYTIDLHGNSKKKETAPDGSADVNVFDIMQGVSINIFVKTGQKKVNQLGKVFHYDLFGKRDFKYDFLSNNSLKTIDYQELPNKAPNFYMVQKNFEAEDTYNLGFALNEIYKINSLGLLTKKDRFITDLNKVDIEKRLMDFLDNSLSNEELANKYKLKIKDNDKWDLAKSRIVIQQNGILQEKLIKQNYRCFDIRYIYYDSNFVARLNTKVLNNIKEKSYGLISTRQLASNQFYHVFISDIISDQCFISNKTKEGCQVFPLYLYPEQTNQQATEETAERTPNLNLEIVKEIEKKLDLTFTNEKETTQNTFAPIDVLDYIYAVLHSPTYREKYKEFLKIDFPRVPYPKDQATFWQLVKLGKEIREVHLLESEIIENYITSYPETGDNIITRSLTKNNIGYEAITDTLGKVWINDTQYFNNVPLVAWEFYIGGYQPAQKWLKDRKDRELSFEDILHYQKIIVALTETHRIMQEIDKIEIE